MDCSSRREAIQSPVVPETYNHRGIKVACCVLDHIAKLSLKLVLNHQISIESSRDVGIGEGCSDLGCAHSFVVHAEECNLAMMAFVARVA